MKYKEHFENNDKKVVNEIKKIIEAESLNTKQKNVNQVLKRHYLMNFVRENTTLSLAEIGKLFNRHHSSVIWGIQNHEIMTELKDKQYKTYTKTVKSYVTKLVGNDDLSILREKIKGADTLKEFYSIREKVRKQEL